MTVILRHKKQFTMDQYDNVTNIAFNTSTKIVTLTYGNNQTTSYDCNNWLLFVTTI